ncbi:stAR-related lipid transfer protein 7, mitochondrial isoform X2 [Ischnura elegans]|uniref:stAR-related lipid transfer protein 7, mitochondrial isoform X2 n=1 Tax=Ischnura elegans TaxID=197161 RepID=UPI001ED89CAC|nr:stAR-related lipid transfer protein 7, mitochondrial isoform X2 [Ischnura elegans]
MHFIGLVRTVFRSQWQSRCVSAPSIPAECFLLDKRWMQTRFGVKNSRFRTDIVNLAEKIYVKLFSEVRNANSPKDLLYFIRNNFLTLKLKLKTQSVNVVRHCTKQFECVVAHRVRRGQQVFSLYSRIWDEKALEEIIRRMRRNFFTRGKEIIFTACGVLMFNWETERIPDAIMASYKGELDFVRRLEKTTLICTNCGNRLLIDRRVKNITYCECGKISSPAAPNVCEWMPYAEREDMLIWRRASTSRPDLYMYKAYGKFSEISAVDFLQVQIDTNYRMKWDKTVADLHVVDSDPDSHSDIIYWEVKWPQLFSNRDYVFNRRVEVDNERKLMIIVNKNSAHPSVPQKANALRVSEYWSYMVIKPFTDFTEPGIEFVLTYCDDPGMNMPSAVAGWVAMSALPDFLVTLRDASQPGKIKAEVPKGDLALTTSLLEAFVGATAIRREPELIV